jgi:acyl dehydratase
MTESETTNRTISDAEVERLRERLGAYYVSGPYRLDVSADDIRNNALANGDLNPLYIDSDYGQSTRFRGPVAPPTYVDLIKHYTATGVGGLPGIHAFHAGNDIEFFSSVRPGDRIGASYRPWRVEEKQGAFAGRMVAVDVDIAYRNSRDKLVARAHGNVFRLVREEARKRGKYRDVQRDAYSDEHLQKIQDTYDSEEIRGDRPRYWEEVHVGQKLGPIVRGPLRIVEISFRGHFGAGKVTGAGAHSSGGHYYQFEEYLRRPEFAEVEEATGVMDHPHRGHWEESFARKIGVPGVYDVAVQRTAWIATLLTNWAGDDGWLQRLWCQFRRFNVAGDTTWISGEVARKWVADGRHMVEVRIESLNQRGESTTPGGAYVVLPSRYGDGIVPQ